MLQMCIVVAVLDYVCVCMCSCLHLFCTWLCILATPLPSAYHNSVSGFEYHGGTEGAGGGGGGDDGGSQGSYNGDPKSLVSSLKRCSNLSLRVCACR